MGKEGMPVRGHARECDECTHMEEEFPGSCPVKEFQDWVRNRVDDKTYTIHRAYVEAEERGLYGPPLFKNGPSIQANLFCPHRIENPQQEDLFLFQLNTDGWVEESIEDVL